MKHLDLLFSCSSSSSTATLSGGSKPRSTGHHRLGGNRKAAGCLCPAVMCRRSSSLNRPVDPKAYYSYFEKGRKSRSGGPKESDGQLRRRSAADVADLMMSKPADSKYFDLLDDSTKKTELVRRQDQDHDHIMLTQQYSRHSISLDGRSPYPTARCSRRNQQQVVELRVSIHCKGCEGKVRKHISKMEGVTSVNIDLAMKKVTVVGDVTPLGVLASISQVKTAQLWPSPSSSYSYSLMSSSSSSSSSSSN